MTTENVLVFDGVSKRFGRTIALNDLTLHLRGGEIYGLLGPNGAGKTTALRAATGLIRATSGSITLFGQDLRPGSSVITRVGAIVGEPALYSHLTTTENVRAYAWMRGLKVHTASVQRVLEFVGLEDARRSRARDLSTGMRKRLALALTLVGKPDVLLLDEPTSGMDPLGTRTVRDLLREIVEDFGTAIIVSSHQLAEVESTCDRVGLLWEGQVVREGTLDALLPQSMSVRVRTSDPKLATRTLERAGGTCRIVSEFECWVSGIQPDKVLEILAAQPLRVSEVSRERMSLEDLFHETVRELVLCLRSNWT